MEQIVCWMAANVEALGVVAVYLTLASGFVVAVWRYRMADRNLLRDRYKMGMEMLNLRYRARVSGAAILADILSGKSTEYDESIIRAFEASLFSPSVFGGDIGNHKKGEVDYESRETWLMVRALRRYVKERGAVRLQSLPLGLPFIITEKSVEPDTNHPSYRAWMESTGNRPPKYGD